MARIVVNDRPLMGKRTGIGQYLAAVLAHWPREEFPDLELVGLHERDLFGVDSTRTFDFPSLESVAPVSLKPLAQISLPRPNWKSRLKSIMSRLGIERAANAQLMKSRWKSQTGDLYFEPNTLAIGASRPLVSTMFDLSVIEVPQCHPADRVRQWTHFLRESVQQVDHWLSISKTTAETLERLCGIPVDQQTIVPMASRWGSPPAAWQPELVRKNLQLPERYIAYLGTIEPRKNIICLLDAYAQASPDWRRDHPLLLVGGTGWGNSSYWRSLIDHPMARETMVTGYVSDAQAAAILRGARALVYPSIYEGFAIPPIESMALQTPVVASNASCIPDTCGEAALLVDPNDPSGWLAAIKQITAEGPLRQSLIARGLDRAVYFSWEETARRHAQLFAKLTGSRTEGEGKRPSVSTRPERRIA